MLHHSGWFLLLEFSDNFMHGFLSCSVVASKDFEEQKSFSYNADKEKGKQEKRSLMSNDIGEDDYL
jgi:hypothetical protein